MATTVAAPYIRSANAAAIKFRIGHAEAIGSPLTQAFDQWAKTIKAKSGGRIEPQHFPAGQLGSYTQLIEGSRIGTIHATAGGPDTEEAVAPEIAPFGGAPGFIYANEAHVDKVLQGPLGDQISKIARQKTGVEFVAYGEAGFRHLLSKRPVTSLGELKGLKMRVPEIKIWIDFWRKLGANPTPLPYAQQYNSLSTGVIAGLEADFFSIRGYKWHEQAKHLTLAYHWFLPKAIRVNAKWLDALPADLQELVRSSAKLAFAEQRKQNRANAESALGDLKKVGVTVHTLSDAEKKRWVGATDPLFAEFGKKSAATAAMIAKIRALR
ncbi:MAG TPA: TRAP transporter substrate-binding protein [Alphaproteobacteria bacterium]|nr:TRAP transporter substrate-binding protein [Alphaproteobacteria bacterium]